jgi:hypothetical protein
MKKTKHRTPVKTSKKKRIDISIANQANQYGEQ